MNKKGFMLLETLVASTFILGVLIFLYIQFANLQRAYNTSFKYNTIPGLYNAKLLGEYITDEGYAKLSSKIDTKGYAQVLCIDFDSLCSSLTKAINAKVILYTGNDIGALQSDLKTSKADQNIFDEEFKRYILSLEQTTNNGRLIIKYIDENNVETFANIVVG